MADSFETLDQNVRQEIAPTQKTPLTPNAIKGMVFGIISILSSGFVITGFIFAIMAFSYSSKDMPTVNAYPVKYRSSGSMLKAGRICASIGLPISALYILYYIWFFSSGIYTMY